MKGFVGFLVGLIGLCFFAAVFIIVPMTMRPGRGDSVVILLFILLCAFAFLNVMVVGFYRILAGLNEAALLPDDAYYYPIRGRALFFTGYVGLLGTLGLALMMAVLPEIMRFRMGRDTAQALFAFTWFVGWTFFGLMLGGVLAMLRDLHQKFYLGGRGRRYDEMDDIDLRRSGQRPRSRRDYDDRDHDDRHYENRTEEQQAPRSRDQT